MTERGRSVSGAVGLSPLTSHTFMVPRVDRPGNKESSQMVASQCWSEWEGYTPHTLGHARRAEFSEDLSQSTLRFSLYIYSHTTQQETYERKNSATVCSSCDFPQGHKAHLPLPPKGLGSLPAEEPQVRVPPPVLRQCAGPRSTSLW